MSAASSGWIIANPEVGVTLRQTTRLQIAFTFRRSGRERRPSTDYHPISSASEPPSVSVLARISQTCQYAPHISKAADNARHRILGMNLILQIDEALVPHGDQGFKNSPHRHKAVSHCDLALFVLEVRKVLHVYVKQPRACFVDRLNNIRAGTSRMPHIDAAPDARIHALYCLQYIQR